MINIDKNKSAGFSLVEILLYMALFLGFLILLSGLFVSTLDAQTDATSTSHTDQDAWYLANRLRHDLYRADSVLVPANNGDTTNTLVLDVGGSQITYSLVNSKMTITENAQSESLNSGDVTMTNLAFQRLGNTDGISTISISAILRNSIIGQVKDIDITVGLRQ